MKIAYSLSDGCVYIVIPAPKTDIERMLGALTDKAYEDHILQISVPPGAVEIVNLPDNWVELDPAQRAAWRIKDGKVVIVESDKP